MLLMLEGLSLIYVVARGKFELNLKPFKMRWGINILSSILIIVFAKEEASYANRRKDLKQKYCLSACHNFLGYAIPGVNKVSYSRYFTYYNLFDRSDNNVQKKWVSLHQLMSDLDELKMNTQKKKEKRYISCHNNSRHK